MGILVNQCFMLGMVHWHWPLWNGSLLVQKMKWSWNLVYTYVWF